VTYVGFLWRLDCRDIADRRGIRLAAQELLRRSPDVFESRVDLEPRGHDILLAFFTRASTAKEAIDKARAVLRQVATATETRPSTRAEWAGIAEPTPDAGKSETFPPIPSLSVLRLQRAQRFSAGDGAAAFRVVAAIFRLRESERVRAADYLRRNLEKMPRVGRPMVHANTPEQLTLEFSVSSRNAEEAAQFATNLLEAAFAMTAGSPEEFDIEIQSIRGEDVSALN